MIIYTDRFSRVLPMVSGQNPPGQNPPGQNPPDKIPLDKIPPRTKSPQDKMFTLRVSKGNEERRV